MSLHTPAGVAVDSSGNLFVSNLNDNLAEEVDVSARPPPTTTITTTIGIAAATAAPTLAHTAADLVGLGVIGSSLLGMGLAGLALVRRRTHH